MKAAAGQEVEVDTPELNAMRRTLVQMLFVEGNHFCPGCEKSGNCQLQALGYEFEMTNPHFVHFFPDLGVDASHPDALIDRNRCIQCELCVRASRDVDGKDVFALGRARHRAPRSSSIRRAASSVDSDFAITDKAAHVCPVGAILIKRVGFAEPIGERDLRPRADQRRSRWPAKFRRAEMNDAAPRPRQSAHRDDLARRLLRLPHVAARHRRAYFRARRHRRIRPLADDRHQALRPLRHRADRGRRLQLRERACAARIARQRQDPGRGRRLRDQRRPAGDAQSSRHRQDPHTGLSTTPRRGARARAQRSRTAAAARQGLSDQRGRARRLFPSRLPALGRRDLEISDRSHPRAHAAARAATSSTTTERTPAMPALETAAAAAKTFAASRSSL